MAAIGSEKTERMAKELKIGNGASGIGHWVLGIGRNEDMAMPSPPFLLPSSDFHRTDIRYIRYIIRCRTSFGYNHQTGST